MSDSFFVARRWAIAEMVRAVRNLIGPELVKTFNSAASDLTGVHQDWWAVYVGFISSQGLELSSVIPDSAVSAFVEEITQTPPDGEAMRILRMIRSVAKIVPTNGVPVSTFQIAGLIAQEIREGRIRAWGPDYSRVIDVIEDAENDARKLQGRESEREPTGECGDVPAGTG